MYFLIYPGDTDDSQYVHLQEEGCIGFYIPDDQEIFWCPGDILRTKQNLKVRGDIQPYLSSFNTGELLILILTILIAPQGCISSYIPRNGSMMREWLYTPSTRDLLGCTSPTTKRYPEAQEMSQGRSPRDINTSLLLAVYGYNTSWLDQGYSHSLINYPSQGCIRKYIPVMGRWVYFPGNEERMACKLLKGN